MALVDFRQPPIPNEASYDIEASLRSLLPTAAGLVHCMGWRFRPAVSMPITYTDATTTYETTPGSVTHYMRFRVTPLARYLFVCFHYQAANAISSAREIEINLYSTAGVLQDGPVTLDSEDGELATDTDTRRVGIVDALEYPDLQGHAGTGLRPAGDDRPGLINVPSDVRGEKVELRLACTDVRLRSVTVIEVATQEIT